MPKPPGGIRNFNGGNLRHDQKWQGLAKEQPDPDFATFEARVWGLRALMKVPRATARPTSWRCCPSRACR